MNKVKMNKKGVEDGFKNMLFAFILITLFAFLLISAVNSIGTNYEMDTTQVTGGALDENKFYGNISGIRTASENFQKRFSEGSVWSAIAGVVVDGIFGLTRDMIIMILAPFNLISNIATSILGIPAIVVNVISGILILTIIFSIWRILKIGD